MIYKQCFIFVSIVPLIYRPYCKCDYTDMNILFLLHSYPKIGGIEMVTSTISTYLERNHKLFYLARIAVPFNQCGECNSCYYFPSSNVKDEISYLRKLVKQLSIDVIINQGPFMHYNKVLGKIKFERTRIISFLHFMPGFDFERAKHAWKYEHNPVKRLFKRFKIWAGIDSAHLFPDKIRSRYRELYSFSDKVVVLSPSYIRTFMSAYHQQDSSKLVYIPNPSRFAIKSKDVIKEKKRVVIFVGRLEFESKRLDRLVSIWHSIGNRMGWRLKIIGDGPYMADLKSLIGRMQTDDIELVGQVTDVSSYYSEAAIVALTSSFEGLSLCFIEALQFGCVPLSFDVSIGNRDIVSQLSPDLLIKPFDEQAYASRLSELMNDRPQREALARKALEVGEQYELGKVGGLWDKLLG